MKFPCFLALVICTPCSVVLERSQQAETPRECEGVEAFGICDPFVPGTVISLNKPEVFLVLSTWPGGPAEKAGICPGDEIVAVNGVSGSGGSSQPMLREIVSHSPTPVRLSVKREGRELIFRVPRVRESTLASLSKRSLMRARDYSMQERPFLVPADQTREELTQLEKFLERLDRRYGFKWEAGLWVPAETPAGNMKLLLSLRAGSDASNRVRDILGGSGPQEDAYSPGFVLVLLDDPREVIIHWLEPDSPARQAGLLPGDELLEVDGRRASALSSEDLSRLFFKAGGPRQIKLQARRGEGRFGVQVQTEPEQSLARAWASYAPLPLRTRDPAKDEYILGVEVLRAEDPPEAIIADVDYPSPAFEAGLHVGDLLVEINGRPLEEVSRERLAELLSPTGPAETALAVYRLGRRIEFKLRPVTFAQAQATIGRILTRFGPAPPACAPSQ